LGTKSTLCGTFGRKGTDRYLRIKHNQWSRSGRDYIRILRKLCRLKDGLPRTSHLSLKKKPYGETSKFIYNIWKQQKTILQSFQALQQDGHLHQSMYTSLTLMEPRRGIPEKQDLEEVSEITRVLH